MAKVSLAKCRGYCKADLEQAMGITDLLKRKPNKKQIAEIEKSRKELEPVIEQHAQALFKWFNL